MILKRMSSFNPEHQDPVDIIMDEIQYMPKKLLFAIVGSMTNVVGFISIFGAILKVVT